MWGHNFRNILLNVDEDVNLEYKNVGIVVQSVHKSSKDTNQRKLYRIH